MGGKNPIKQVTNMASDMVTTPLAAISRGVGAEGVANLFENVGSETKKAVGTTVDITSGKAADMKAKAEKEGKIAAAQAQEQMSQEEKRRAAAESARIEGERMAPGSRARTLLTGAGGVEDEKKPVTRRTLLGF